MVSEMENLNNYGYQVCYMNGKQILLHRHLYEIYHNIILKSTDIIHHIDGNRQNNSKENLKLCTVAENNLSRKVSRKSKSGIKNIQIFENYYLIKIVKDGEIKFKQKYYKDLFSLEDVIEIRNIELVKHHGEFACFR